MKILEYMKLQISQITKEIIAQHNLNYIVSPDGWVYIEIQRLIPG